MASLAEHLSAPSVAAAPVAQTPIAADLAPIGLFCMGLTLIAISCSAFARYLATPSRR